MKKFKMPTAHTLILLIIVVVAVLTWVVPAGSYEYVDPNAEKLMPIAGTYEQTEQNPQGLWDVLISPITGFADAITVAFYVLVLGGYLAVVMKTGAIDAAIGSIIRKLKGRESALIPILMTVFALGGTTFGMWEETMGFYLIIIPVFIAAGYDALTGVYVVLLGAGIGTMASTVNPFATGIASGFADISIGDGLPLRLLMFFGFLAVGIWFVMRYAKKVKHDPKLSVIYDMKTQNEKHFLGDTDMSKPMEFTPKRKAALVVFCITFILMIVAVIPWAGKFGITIFEDATAFLQNIPGLGTVLGHMVPLGDWWFGELSMMFLASTIITGFIAYKDEAECAETFISGARDLFSVALVIGFARGIVVVMNAGGMTATILHFGEIMLTGLSKSVFAVLTFIFYLPLSFFMPSSSALATLSTPIVAPLCDFAGVGRDIGVTAFQTANGLINLITPTSGVVMGALALGKIPYDRFLKHVIKLFGILFVLSTIILAIGAVL